MQSAPLSDLSERERQCLRHVYQHKQSKEIARLLALSKRTVDGYLDSARGKLGVATRIQAATLLADAERAAVPYRITGDPIPVSIPPTIPHSSPATERAAGPDGAGRGDGLGEERAVFVHDKPAIDPLATFPVARPGRPTNELTAGGRIATIFRITSRLVFYPALLLITAEALSRLAISLLR